MIPPTLTLDEASRRRWDAVVIGAGPSGAMAARELARRRARVLLVDRSNFPRGKVCGCCLNLRAIDALRRAGLANILDESHAVTLQDVRIASSGRSALLPLPGGAALSRERFDAALIRAAIEAGAEFLPHTTAAARGVDDGTRRVSLASGKRAVSAGAKVVIAASGLGSSLALRETGIEVRVARNSRIGAGVIVDDAPADYAPGTTYMSTAPGGYVGMVRLEDGRLDVAAAFDPAYVRRAGGLGPAAATILRCAGLPPIAGLARKRWHGTTTLTRRPTRVASERLFLIGDAAGYVEPFTGEGIACALDCGLAVARLAERGLERWDESVAREWIGSHRAMVVRRQYICRMMGTILRRPTATRLLIAALTALPALASPFVERLNAPARDAIPST